MDRKIRSIQRKNGQIIIQAMMALDEVTLDAIVEKICVDFNVSTGRCPNVTLPDSDADFIAIFQ